MKSAHSRRVEAIRNVKRRDQTPHSSSSGHQPPGLRESRLHEGAGGSLMPLAPAGDHEIPLTFTANPAASFVPDTDKSEVEVGIGGGGSSRRMKLTARRVSISCPGSAHRDTELIRRARLNSRDSPLQWAPSPPSPYMFAHANGDFGKTHDEQRLLICAARGSKGSVCGVRVERWSASSTDHASFDRLHRQSSQSSQSSVSGRSSVSATSSCDTSGYLTMVALARARSIPSPVPESLCPEDPLPALPTPSPSASMAEPHALHTQLAPPARREGGFGEEEVPRGHTPGLPPPPPPTPSPCLSRLTPSPQPEHGRPTAILGIQDIKPPRSPVSPEKPRSRHHSLVLHPIIEKEILAEGACGDPTPAVTPPPRHDRHGRPSRVSPGPLPPAKWNIEGFLERLEQLKSSGMIVPEVPTTRRFGTLATSISRDAELALSNPLADGKESRGGRKRRTRFHPRMFSWGSESSGKKMIAAGEAATAAAAAAAAAADTDRKKPRAKSTSTSRPLSVVGFFRGRRRSASAPSARATASAVPTEGALDDVGDRQKSQRAATLPAEISIKNLAHGKGQAVTNGALEVPVVHRGGGAARRQRRGLVARSTPNALHTTGDQSNSVGPRPGSAPGSRRVDRLMVGAGVSRPGSAPGSRKLKVTPAGHRPLQAHIASAAFVPATNVAKNHVQL